MSMKSLITAIQTSLKNAATLSSVADADIVITPDENYIPQTIAYPAIGLKDGPIVMEKEAAAAGSTLLWNVVYQVHVIIYVAMADGEVPLIGQTSPAVKGILDLNDLVRTILHENSQSITGIIDSYCVAETESEIIGGNDMIILKKTMTFEYQALETL